MAGASARRRRTQQPRSEKPMPAKRAGRSAPRSRGPKTTGGRSAANCAGAVQQGTSTSPPPSARPTACYITSSYVPPAVRAAARRVRPPATGAVYKRRYMICGRRWAAAAGERARPMASTAKPRAAAGARWPRFQTSPFSVAALYFPGPRPLPSRGARVRFGLYAKYKALAPIAPGALYVFNSNRTQRVLLATHSRPECTRHTGCSTRRRMCPEPHNTRHGHARRRKR